MRVLKRTPNYPNFVINEGQIKEVLRWFSFAFDAPFKYGALKQLTKKVPCLFADILTYFNNGVSQQFFMIKGTFVFRNWGNMSSRCSLNKFRDVFWSGAMIVIHVWHCT